MTGHASTDFVVDDDDSFRKSVARLLRASGYATECFSSAADFLARQPAQARGCVLADLQMPGMDGIALQEALLKSEAPLPTVFITGHVDIPTAVKAMRLGAEDFLIKTAPKEGLLAAIDRALAHDDRQPMERDRHKELQVRFERLTPRETEVRGHVLRGELNKQIAATLGIDERTVKRHRTSLMRKLEVKSVANLVQLATEAGVSKSVIVRDDEFDTREAPFFEP